MVSTCAKCYGNGYVIMDGNRTFTLPKNLREGMVLRDRIGDKDTGISN